MFGANIRLSSSPVSFARETFVTTCASVVPGGLLATLLDRMSDRAGGWQEVTQVARAVLGRRDRTDEAQLPSELLRFVLLAAHRQERGIAARLELARSLVGKETSPPCEEEVQLIGVELLEGDRLSHQPLHELVGFR